MHFIDGPRGHAAAVDDADRFDLTDGLQTSGERAPDLVELPRRPLGREAIAKPVKRFDGRFRVARAAEGASGIAKERSVLAASEQHGEGAQLFEAAPRIVNRLRIRHLRLRAEGVDGIKSFAA